MVGRIRYPQHAGRITLDAEWIPKLGICSYSVSKRRSPAPCNCGHAASGVNSSDAMILSRTLDNKQRQIRPQQLHNTFDEQSAWTRSHRDSHGASYISIGHIHHAGSGIDGNTPGLFKASIRTHTVDKRAHRRSGAHARARQGGHETRTGDFANTMSITVAYITAWSQQARKRKHIALFDTHWHEPHAHLH